METFRVMKVSRQYGDKGKPFRHVIVPDAGNRESALILAEVACIEHMEAIFVSGRTEWRDSDGNHIGFAFRTSNATHVRYVVESNG